MRDGRIADIGRSVNRPDGAEVIDLSERTVSPGFIDTHVHLTMDASDLAQQTLESSAAKALKGLSLAREYLRYGFTTLRDLGSMDPEFPTVDLRNALDAGSSGPAAGGRRAHHQLLGRPRRPARLLRLALGPAGLGDRRQHRRRSAGLSAASTPTARTGSRPPTPAATSARATTLPAEPGLTTRWRRLTSTARLLGHAGRRAHRRCRGVQTGDPLRRPQPRARLPDRRGGHRHGRRRRRLHRADDADDPGGPRATQAAPCPARRYGSSAATTSRSSTPSGCWPPATPRSPSAPTAACSRSATASGSSRRWSRPG